MLFPEIIYTAVTIVCLLIVRTLLIGVVKQFAAKSEKTELRTKLIIKHINYLIVFTFLMLNFMIWGIDFSDIGLVFSSVFAVIGVAFFAQWSILSNATSGIIMFFTFPFRIGDRIKIHDKDFVTDVLIIEDIRTFQMILRTENGELLTYPNNLVLQKGITMVSASEHYQSEHPLPEVGNKNIPESID